MDDVEGQDSLHGIGRNIRGLVGRWPDADGILQGGMSEGLRDWDLWCLGPPNILDATSSNIGIRGPLIFCLLLSLFLSLRASKAQTDLVFSGVFSIIWIGEVVVTLQIKLLGGQM
jgi:protein YIPF6